MQHSSSSENGLQYKIAIKQQYVVVAFSGSMSKQCMETVEKCVQEVIETKAKFLVVMFHDVPRVDRPVIGTLVKAQKNLRENGMALRLCNFKPEILKNLVEAGAVRGEEVAETLQEALVSFTQPARSAS